MDERDITELEAALGRRFRDPELLRQALTHRSRAHESSTGDNELLEFLGDSVLGLVVSDALFHAFPKKSEGELSKLRSHLVSARHLARVAHELDLGEFLRLGRGEEKSGGRKKAALLANALEAVLAALYLDGGPEAARSFILARIVEPEIAGLRAGTAPDFLGTDYKSALQERVQALGRPQPRYQVVTESGPAHHKNFTVELKLQAPGNHGHKVLVTQGEGPSKKIAEQRAAQQALEKLSVAEEAL